MQIMNRAKYALTGEDAASNMELIVWFAVVLGIATFLFLLRDQIGAFIATITDKIGAMTGTASNLDVTRQNNVHKPGIIDPNAPKAS